MLYVNCSHLKLGGVQPVLDALATHAHKLLTSTGANSTSVVKPDPDPVQVCFETAHPVTAATPIMFGDELQAEPRPGIPGLEVIVHYGGDGALVVQIDTKDIDMISWRGQLRVNLNEDTIYAGDSDTPSGVRLAVTRPTLALAALTYRLGLRAARLIHRAFMLTTATG